MTANPDSGNWIKMMSIFQKQEYEGKRRLLVTFSLKYTWFGIEHTQRECYCYLGLMYMELTRNLRTEIKLVSHMRMAKYKDIKDDRTERRVLLGQTSLLFSPTKLNISIVDPKMNGKHYCDCYLPADICIGL